MKDGFVAMDELWLLADARTSRATKNRITSNILAKSRKRGLTISFTAQVLSSIDSRIRQIVDFISYPIMNPNETLVKLLIFRGSKANNGNYMKTLYYKTPLVYQMYDSILPDQKIMYFNDNELHIEEVGDFNPDAHKKVNLHTVNDENKIEIKQPNRFIEHFVNKDCYEIKTDYGRKIKVTGDHSVMVWDGKKLIPKFARSLEKTDKLAIPRKLKIKEKDKKEIMLIDLLKSENKKLKKKYDYNLMVTGRNIKKIIFDKKNEIIEIIKNKHCYKTIFNNWKKKNSLPFYFYIRLSFS
jgi:hypothetical protein